MSFLATRRGKATLALLCGIAFLDFVDGSITNVALPSIRRSLHFSVDGLTWIPSGYLLTYGGRSEEHTSELQSRLHLVCRLLLEKKKQTIKLPHLTQKKKNKK